MIISEMIINSPAATMNSFLSNMEKKQEYGKAGLY
jgi:hypothetical protein